MFSYSDAMPVSVPPGWPAEVPPPDSGGFQVGAIRWLLDKVPPGYRGYDVFERWPAALALLAHYHAKAVLDGYRQGYRTVRTDLAGGVPAHVIDAVLEVYRVEGERHAGTARSVDLVARALFHAG